MSRPDLLARVRSLDPMLRFHDGEEPIEATLERVLEKSRRSETARRRFWNVSRVGAIAAAAIGVVLLLPALAVGTGPFHILGPDPSSEATPVNGLLVAKGADGLVVVDPKSGGTLALQGTAELDHPVWSPDARYLAVEKAEKGGTSVYTVWPNGTHPQLIMENASAPAWSDDGTRIFVQRDTCTAPGGCEESDEDSTTVYSIAANGTDAHEVGDDDYDVSQPGWPPGQNVLSFLADEGSRDTGGLPTSVDSTEATWSPDGTELAIADAPRGIWMVNDDGVLRLVVKGAFSSLSWGTERTTTGSPSASTRPAAGSAQR